MVKKLARLFTIKTRFEVIAVIYALAVGAVERGEHYLQEYPGYGGWLLFAACTTAVFMAGARLMEMTRRDSGARRRRVGLSMAPGSWLRTRPWNVDCGGPYVARRRSDKALWRFSHHLVKFPKRRWWVGGLGSRSSR